MGPFHMSPARLSIYNVSRNFGFSNLLFFIFMKHIPRLFLPSSSFHRDRVVIDDAEHHHQLTRVMRVQPGDQLVALDGDTPTGHHGGSRLAAAGGRGKEYPLKIMTISKREVVCRYLDESMAYPNGREARGEPRVLIRLFQALPKQLSKFEEVLRHGTEIGIAEFYPLITRNVEGGGYGRGANEPRRVLPKRERMEHILVEAAEQSERGRVPVLGPEVNFGEVLESGWPARTTGAAGLGTNVTLVAAEREEKTFLWDVLPSLTKVKSINIVVGPEGGFTEEELAKAREAGFKLFGLGPRILRTETAGLAVASALLFGSSLGAS